MPFLWKIIFFHINVLKKSWQFESFRLRVIIVSYRRKFCDGRNMLVTFRLLGKNAILHYKLRFKAIPGPQSPCQQNTQLQTARLGFEARLRSTAMNGSGTLVHVKIIKGAISSKLPFKLNLWQRRYKIRTEGSVESNENELS